jgi:hypothetical protein
LSFIDTNRTVIGMRFYTVALRGLLVVLAVGAVLAYLLLYVISLDLAAEFPPLAHLRLPLFLVAVGAGLPAVVALGCLWSFSALVAQGEGFSPATVRLLRIMRNSFAVMAAYLLVAYVAITVAMQPGESPQVFLAFCVGEVVALFLLTYSAVMVGLFDNGTSIRQEHELTV